MEREACEYIKKSTLVRFCFIARFKLFFMAKSSYLVATMAVRGKTSSNNPLFRG
jgi:hypothetical protein